MAGLIKSQVIALVDGDPNSIEILNENHGFSLAKLINSTTKWVYDSTKPIGSRWVLDGLNNYELAVANGFEGTYEEWELTQHGADGKSKYVSYLETTTDTPPLSEQEWSDSFKFTETDPVFQAWINSNPLNGLITLNDIPDATQIVRGFVNIGTQSFKGNKTIIGESTTIGNALEILNSSGTSLVKFGNNGNIGVGVNAPEYKLDVAGNLRVDGNYVIQIKTASSDYLVLSKSGTLDGGIYSGVGNLILQNNLRNVAIGGVTPTAKLTVLGADSLNQNIVDFRTSLNASALVIKNSGNVGIGTTTPNSKLEVNGDIRQTTSRNSIFMKPFGKIWGNETYNYIELYNGSDGALDISAGHNGVGIRFYTSAVKRERMIITTNGNIGIGITTPTSRLTIKGKDTNSLNIFDFMSDIESKMWLNVDVNDNATLNFKGNIVNTLSGAGITLKTPNGLHTYKIAIENNGTITSTLIS